MQAVELCVGGTDLCAGELRDSSTHLSLQPGIEEGLFAHLWWRFRLISRSKASAIQRFSGLQQTAHLGLWSRFACCDAPRSSSDQPRARAHQLFSGMPVRQGEEHSSAQRQHRDGKIPLWMCEVDSCNVWVCSVLIGATWQL
jgi:hypothetical protein